MLLFTTLLPAFKSRYIFFLMSHISIVSCACQVCKHSCWAFLLCSETLYVWDNCTGGSNGCWSSWRGQRVEHKSWRHDLCDLWQIPTSNQTRRWELRGSAFFPNHCFSSHVLKEENKFLVIILLLNSATDPDLKFLMFTVQFCL